MNLIGFIICFVSGMFLLFQSKSLVRGISIFIILTGFSLLAQFLYLLYPSLSVHDLSTLFFLAVIFSYGSMYPLMISVLFLLSTSKMRIALELVLVLLLQLLSLLQYDSGVHHSLTRIPEISVPFAISILLSFNIPVIICFFNLKKIYNTLPVQQQNSITGIQKSLLIIFIYPFVKILALHSIAALNLVFNLYFMNIFDSIIVIAVLSLVYYMPISEDWSISAKQTNKQSY